jgi:hypothetical protein
MYYPTGKTTGGRMLVCMCCEDIIPNPVTDSVPYQIGEFYADTNEACQYSSANEMECAIREKLDEMDACVECWQVESALKEAGFLDYSLQEMEGGMATLGTVNGMGPVTAPTFPGASQATSAGGLSPNQGFYSASWNGSGDRFDARAIKSSKKKNKSPKDLPRKFKNVQSFKNFLASKKNK